MAQKKSKEDTAEEQPATPLSGVAALRNATNALTGIDEKVLPSEMGSGWFDEYRKTLKENGFEVKNVPKGQDPTGDYVVLWYLSDVLYAAAIPLERETVNWTGKPVATSGIAQRIQITKVEE